MDQIKQSLSNLNPIETKWSLPNLNPEKVDRIKWSLLNLNPNETKQPLLSSESLKGG